MTREAARLPLGETQMKQSLGPGISKGWFENPSLSASK